MKVDPKKLKKTIFRIGSKRNFTFSPDAVSYLMTKGEAEVQSLLGSIVASGKKITSRVIREYEEQINSQNERVSFRQQITSSRALAVPSAPTSSYRVLPPRSRAPPNPTFHQRLFHFLKSTTKFKKEVSEELVLYSKNGTFDRYDVYNPTLKTSEQRISSKIEPLIPGSFYLIDNLKRVKQIQHLKEFHRQRTDEKDSGFHMLIVNNILFDKEGVFDSLKSMFRNVKKFEDVRVMIIFGKLYQNEMTRELRLQNDMRRFRETIPREVFRQIKEFLFIPSFESGGKLYPSFGQLHMSEEENIFGDRKFRQVRNPFRLYVPKVKSMCHFFEFDWGVGLQKEQMCEYIAHNRCLVNLLNPQYMIRNFWEEFLMFDQFENDSKISHVVFLADDSKKYFKMEYKNIVFINVPSFTRDKCFVLSNPIKNKTGFMRFFG